MAVQEIPYMTRDVVEARAVDVLKQYDLFQVPVEPLTLASHLGIEVSYGDFDSDDISGMLRINNSDYEILVNGEHSPYRVRFTIAHELGHYVLHRSFCDFFVDSERKLFRTHDNSDSTPGDVRMEIQANLFAAALLMPAELVKQEFQKTQSLGDLSHRFKVSREAMGFRLDNLGLS